MRQPPKRTRLEVITPHNEPGELQFNAEAYEGQGKEGKGLMMVQVQVHPLPNDPALFSRLVNAMNKVAAEVLAADGMILSVEPERVHESDDIADVSRTRH